MNLDYEKLFDRHSLPYDTTFTKHNYMNKGDFINAINELTEAKRGQNELQVSQVNGGLDLELLAKRVDEQLAKETPESLSLWFYKQRLLEMYYDLKESQLEEKYKKQLKTFIDGIDSRLSG